MNFVSEKELQKKREEAGDGEAISEPADFRPLYERLKEVRDKKQLEWEEDHTLKNQFGVTRGIDEGDADFLEQIDRVKEEQEARKRREEMELIEMARRQSCGSIEQLPLLERPQKQSTRSDRTSGNKQARLLSALVRKRSHSRISADDELGSQKEKAILDDSPSISNTLEEPPAKKKVCAIPENPAKQRTLSTIPSMIDYSDSSDEEPSVESSANSESFESELPSMSTFTKDGNTKSDKCESTT